MGEKNGKVQMKRKAVFLDRDGTVNKEVNYLSKIEQVMILPNAAAAIRLLNEKGFIVVVITNQSGVGRGYFSEDDLRSINEHITSEVKKEGARIDAFYYCPHIPGEGCECRKPKSGMLRQAAKEHDIDLSSSYVVGDKMLDLASGYNVGLRTVLVLTGYGKDELGKKDSWEFSPHHIAEDLYDAVKWILGDG